MDIRKPFARYDVLRIMAEKEPELLDLYQQKHDAIVHGTRQLDELVFQSGHWWLNDPGLSVALRQVRDFIENMQHNFGEQSRAWRQIRSPEHRAERKQQLLQALLQYRAERDAWDSLFD